MRREQEARELECDRLVAAEARKNAEVRRVKDILDSKGILQMLEKDVLPILWEMESSATLETVAEGGVYSVKKKFHSPHQMYCDKYRRALLKRY